MLLLGGSDLIGVQGHNYNYAHISTNYLHIISNLAPHNCNYIGTFDVSKLLEAARKDHNYRYVDIINNCF